MMEHACSGHFLDFLMDPAEADPRRSSSQPEPGSEDGFDPRRSLMDLMAVRTCSWLMVAKMARNPMMIVMTDVV